MALKAKGGEEGLKYEVLRSLKPRSARCGILVLEDPLRWLKGKPKRWLSLSKIYYRGGVEICYWLNGLQREYLSSGKTRKTFTLKHGHLVGPVIRYFDSGVISAKYQYDQLAVQDSSQTLTILVGWNKKYYKNGFLKWKEFRNEEGKKEGAELFFFGNRCSK